MPTMMDDARDELARVHAAADADYGVEMRAAEERYERAFQAIAATRIAAETAARARYDTARDVASITFGARSSFALRVAKLSDQDLATEYRRAAFQAVHGSNAGARANSAWRAGAAREVMRARGLRVGA